MSTFSQIQESLNRTWNAMTVGWRELRELAGDALTRFQPRTSSSKDITPAEERMVGRASRWGLLAAEVSESDKEVGVRLEIPGLDPEDFSIEVHGDILRVLGEKKWEHDEVRGDYTVMERAYGQFERAIQLPAPVDDTKAKAQYQRGVLRVRLPKAKASQSRQITVQSD